MLMAKLLSPAAQHARCRRWLETKVPKKNNLKFEYLSEKEIFDMSNIYTSADQLIGNTPLLELTHLEEAYEKMGHFYLFAQDSNCNPRRIRI